jgi:uncharacterized membrane protein
MFVTPHGRHSRASGYHRTHTAPERAYRQRQDGREGERQVPRNGQNGEPDRPEADFQPDLRFQEQHHGRLAHLPHLGEHVPGLHWKAGALPGWLRKTEGENRWPATITVLVAIALQIVTPDRYALHPRLLLPILEAVLLLALIAANPVRLQRAHPAIRFCSLALTVLMAIANFASVVMLIDQILKHHASNATALLGGGVNIWITNIIVFALCYWEFDRGGPAARAEASRPYPDFLFPQMMDPSKAHESWEPTFVDYLYLSFTNSTAFSPTDTMPMVPWAKLVMLAQSMISLVTVALVAARAVNILT